MSASGWRSSLAITGQNLFASGERSPDGRALTTINPVLFSLQKGPPIQLR
jgi:hypothetical protein